MADRKQQLLEAFEKEESDDEIETVEEELDVDKLASDDTPVVADESGAEPKEEDSAQGKSASKTDAESVAKGGKKSVKAGSASDDSGESSGAPKVLKKPDASKGPQKAASTPTIEETERAAAEAGEAPKAWRPAVREHWKSIHPEAREEINRREVEITQFIGRHGAAIQHKAQFDEAVQPFLPFIAAQQSTPMKAFHGLMTTAARLTTGAPQQKAQVISEIMRNYGVDAKTLDEVLSAQMQGGSGATMPPSQNDPPAWARPMFDFMRETTQARQEREARTQREAAAELAEFEKKPFFSDLRDDIGLLMSRAAEKGQTMTLEQAYAKARKMNSEIDGILTQREKAAAGNGSGALEKARKAASTVRGSPGGSAVGKVNGKVADGKPVDRRATLSRAFDEASEE